MTCFRNNKVSGSRAKEEVGSLWSRGYSESKGPGRRPIMKQVPGAAKGAIVVSEKSNRHTVRRGRD